jgi:hypothetical protein
MAAADFWRAVRDYNRSLWQWWLLAVRAYRNRGVPPLRLTEFVSCAQHPHGKAALQLRKPDAS